MNAMIRVRPLLWSLFAASCVSACAVPPARVGEALAHAPLSAAGPFHLVARFSLQLQATETTDARHFAGRLQWQHGADGDRLLFSDPLGQGVAELRRPPQGAVVVRFADGRERQAPDPEQLLAEVLGAPLPLGELSAWVQARPGTGALVEPDAQGRPRRVRESGWLLSYHYGEGANLPSRLDASLDGMLRLRLFIESWEALP